MFDWLRARRTGSTATDAAPAAPVAPGPTAPPPATPAAAGAVTESAAAAAAASPPPLGALALYLAGRAAEAQAFAQDLLAADADDLQGLHVQALLALDRGQPPQAVRLLERAVALAPQRGDLQIALGRANAAAGRRGAAAAAFQRAAELDPRSGAPLLQLGLLALAGGRADDAHRQFSAALRCEPALAEAQFQMGSLLLGRGQLDDAEQHLRRAIAAQPDHAAALSNLGAMLKDRGRRDEAGRFLERALEVRPGLSPTTFNLAMLRIDQRRWRDAAALLREYLAVEPKQADAHYWLGNALMGEGDATGARKAYQAAVRLNDNYVQARWGQAMAQLPAIAMTDAEQTAGAQAFEREVAKLRAWFRVRPTLEGYLAVGAQQPYYLAYVARNHAAPMADYGTLCSTLMAGWARKVGVPAPVRSTGSKCRLGIVSAHVHSHSVWHAIVRGWIEHLDPARFELHVFATGATRDPQTEWAARRVARLHQGVGDWTAWAKTISDAGLDALVYPEIGMDATTVRLAALRLARTQWAAWGHPLTTGMPTIDGFVSAQAFEPEGAQAHYTESLVALPRMGCCYLPFKAVPAKVDPSVWGIAAADRVLLCAGTSFKYAPRDDAMLVEIARRCRPCKLVFFRAEPGPLSAMLERRLRAAFEAAALPFDDCVRFIPWQSQPAFFGLLDRADVYLDSAGFSGFNTTMQAVERGTPVVAWEGEFMRGRFASGILHQAGLDDWVAHDAAGYVERVERLCADRAARDQVRGQLQVRRDRLFDDRASVAAFAEALLARTGST